MIQAISKRLSPERDAALQAFRVQCREHGALWLRAVIRRYSIDQAKGETAWTLTTSQLWAASRMSLAELATL